MNLPTNTPNLVEYVAGSGADVMWAEGHPTTQFPQHVFGLERLPYTADQWSAIDWSVRAGAFLSLLAGLLVVATFIRWRPFRTPANRLIVFIAVCDLVGAAAMAMGRTFISYGSSETSAACAGQAFAIQFSSLASVAWTVAMSFNLFIVLFLTRTTRDLEAMERYHFFACFGGAFAFAFVPMFVWSGERGGAYGPATTWCWITDNWWDLRLALFFLPLWLAFTTNTLAYVTAAVKIVIKTNKYKDRAKSVNAASSGGLPQLPVVSPLDAPLVSPFCPPAGVLVPSAMPTSAAAIVSHAQRHSQVLTAIAEDDPASSSTNTTPASTNAATTPVEASYILPRSHSQDTLCATTMQVDFDAVYARNNMPSGRQSVSPAVPQWNAGSDEDSDGHEDGGAPPPPLPTSLVPPPPVFIAPPPPAFCPPHESRCPPPLSIKLPPFYANYYPEAPPKESRWQRTVSATQRRVSDLVAAWRWPRAARRAQPSPFFNTTTHASTPSRDNTGRSFNSPFSTLTPPSTGVRTSMISNATTSAITSISTSTKRTLKSFRRRFFIKISLYLLAFLLVWTLPTIWFACGQRADRCEWMHVTWQWTAAQGFVLAARGFVNCLCYFVVNAHGTWKTMGRG